MNTVILSLSLSHSLSQNLFDNGGKWRIGIDRCSCLHRAISLHDERARASRREIVQGSRERASRETSLRETSQALDDIRALEPNAHRERPHFAARHRCLLLGSGIERRVNLELDAR